MSALLDALQKPKQDLVISELLVEFQEKTFEDLFEHLHKIEKLQWFLKSTIGDLIKLPQLKVEEKEVADPEEYKKAILAFLKDYGKGESKMGALSSEIIAKISGTGAQLRKALAELRKDNKVHSVGKTQGMRHVLYKFKDAVDGEYLKKQ